jgi:dephospho-CoA kinase
MLVIGLTGSIATGKTEVAKLFSASHIPVFDADAEVHKIYRDKSFVNMLAQHFPDAIHDGRIDRQVLGRIVLSDATKLKSLEALIHPLVRAQREKFLAKRKKENARFVVMDIPLLYETGQSKDVDYVVVVSTPENIQRERALARPGMTTEKLAGILRRQMPDSEKREHADFIIENAGSLDQLGKQVEALIAKFNAMSKDPKHERNRP